MLGISHLGPPALQEGTHQATTAGARRGVCTVCAGDSSQPTASVLVLASACLHKRLKRFTVCLSSHGPEQCQTDRRMLARLGPRPISDRQKKAASHS